MSEETQREESEQDKETLKEIPIAATLDSYLKLRNFDLEYSDDRVKLFKNLDENKVIKSYTRSDSYIINQIKKKRDRLSENDPICRKLDSIAYYLLKSEYKNEMHKESFLLDKTGEELNNTKENNIAYTKDYKIKEVDRKYGYPIMSVYSMNRNRSDNYHKGKNQIREILITDELKSRFGKSVNLSEDESYTLISQENIVKYNANSSSVYERIIYSFKEPKNISLYFRHEEEILSEIENDPSSEFYLVSHVLEDIIECLGLDREEYFLIDQAREGKSYKQIKKSYNEKHEEKLKYEEIRYKIRIIVGRISEEIRNRIKHIL